MKKEILNKEIKTMNLSSNTTKILRDNDILIIEDLWTQNRKTLKNMGLNDSDINSLIIKLQLIGLDLNKKIY